MTMDQVADGVRVHRSTLLENNTVVVQGESGVLLVDPGITEGELVGLADDLHASRLGVTAGFATHPDWDHALWHPRLGDAPRYGTNRCAAELRTLLSTADWETSVVDVMPPEIAEDVPLRLFGLVTGLDAGATELAWDGPSIRVIEHQGHARGHAALLVEDRRVLVAGDMLSDVLVPMLDLSAEDPMGDYLAGLDLLDGAADDVDVVIPGHGSVGDAEQFRMRVDLDRAYVIALSAGSESDDPRIGPSAKPGWEWVGDVHAGQKDRLRELGLTG